MTFVRSIAFLMFAVILCPGAFAEKRVALVIGNSDYVHAPSLPNPKNDAADMETKLKTLGFQVVSGIDLDLAAMRKTIRNYINSLKGADVALFYYAGHGFQVEGKNYMAPVDARLENENDLDFEAVPIAMVLAAMERNGTTNLIFLDACRNNPLARNLAQSMGTRSAAVGRGLARIGTGIGTLISFATQPGNVAFDGEGRNSPFTAALVEHLGVRGEGISRNLIRVRNAVLKSTEGRQVPWDNSSLTGEVILAPAVAAETENNQILKQNRAAQEKQAEISYWNSIKGAGDKVFFDAYLVKYPDGQFADLARLKLTALKKQVQQLPSSANQHAQNGHKVQTFDRTQLARLDPNAAGSALPDTNRVPAPIDFERNLDLESEDYQRVQLALNALGYDVGSEDGAFGPKSRSGLRKYQIRNRIEESGYLTEKTLAALFELFENTPRTYDGKWLLNFHRWHYGSVDKTGVNLRSLLARATVSVRNGEIFIVDGIVFSSKKTLFDTFKGRITDKGRLTISMTIDSLFDNEPKPQQEVNFAVREMMPMLVPYSRTLTHRGTRLWINKRKGENVWLKLEMTRLQ